MDSFYVAVNAVLPFLIYILIGFIARRAGVTKESFLRELNSVVFKVFFPFIMFGNLYAADFGMLRNAGYVLFAVVATLIVIAVSFAVVPLFEKNDSRKGVLIQAIYRSNSVLFAIPLTQRVFGDAGAAKASILVAFVVPLYNITAVAVLEYFRGGKVSYRKLFVNILKNPLIIGAIAGVIFNLLPVTMPGCFQVPIKELSSLATPMALFVLGGTIHASDIKKNAAPLATCILLKLVIIPIFIVSIASMMRYDPIEMFVIFSVFATPVAASSFPMAQSMGGDADLAGEFVALSTGISIFTIFAWIMVLRGIFHIV
ncbi:MAG: AEC family transporter [Butyrivibrio sp.]|nr:AEC family transporter [Butyrivibrio sp.]